MVGLCRSLVLCACAFGALWAETPPNLDPAEPQLNTQRILGVIPNYQTVTDPTRPYVPLTPKQKWSLFIKESIDPYNVLTAAIGSGFSQMDDATPKYGQGGKAFGLRYAAAMADLTTQNFYSAGVLACLLHQDPRYFRKGPEAGIFHRIAYSASRIVIARQDSGSYAFNYSGVAGTVLGIATSNLYYPSASVRSSVMTDRLFTSFTGSLSGNLLCEFWPDVQKLLQSKFHRGKRNFTP